MTINVDAWKMTHEKTGTDVMTIVMDALAKRKTASETMDLIAEHCEAFHEAKECLIFTNEDNAWEMTIDETGTDINGVLSDFQSGRSSIEVATDLLINQCKVFHKVMDQLSVSDDVNPDYEPE